MFLGLRVDCLSQEKAQMLPGLVPGPHAVGYAVQHHYDHSRTYRNKFDPTGRPTQGEYARPIQISIWYPAEAVKNPKYIKYGEYVDSLATELNFDKPNAFHKQQFLNKIKTQAFGPEGGDAEDWARLERAFQDSCFAIKDARLKSGRFPLIIYAPSAASQAFENSVLGEFLASHGYVVAAFPCNSFDSRWTPSNAADWETLIRDAEFVMEKCRSFPNVDPAKTGVIGYSIGAGVSLYLTARNAHIDANVGIDGAEIVPTLNELFREKFPFYDAISAIRAPSLVMLDVGSGRPFNLGVYDKIKFADAYILKYMATDGHGNFNHLTRFNLICSKNAAAPEIEKFDRLYSTMCLYILNFLDARIKSIGTGRSFLDNPPEANGIIAGTLTVEPRKGAPRPPMADEFMDLVRAEGAKKGRVILAEARKVDPKIKLFSLRDMIVVGQDHYLSGRIREAIDVFELIEDAFAATATLMQKSLFYEYLGRAYHKLGDGERAQSFLKKALEANPNNAAAKALRDEMDKK
jgi:tetratricopeptide (TPR) repeat protein